MVKRLINTAKKAKKSLRPNYISYCSKPIDEKLVLLEGGQGTNINGNMFAMLREIALNDRWKDYKAVFVVTRKNEEAFKERSRFYGFKNVSCVVRNTDEYCRILATAKYLLTDNSFPPFFSKREGQVFLNTWHGTPLKTLGKSDKSNNASLANIQKNYFMSDYALFPNEFTRDVFMNDYDLKTIFKGKSLIANYPRNYVFYDNAQSAAMKTKLGYDGKKVFCYMPTWRGTGRTASTKKQIAKTVELLTELDEKLDDSTVLLVNLHFMLSSAIDCSQFRHIEYFPSEYDTYETVNACDGLITDYSSVFFDFAVTKKKIILYAYDKEEYLESRGVYIPFDSLPFPILENADDVVAEMKKPVEPYDEFIDTYCTNGSERSCEQLFELMVEGKSDVFKLEENEGAGENICLIYADTLPAVYYDTIRDHIDKNPGYNYVVAYRRNLNADKKEFLSSLPENVSTLGLITAFQFKMIELFYALICILDFKIPKKRLNDFFARETDRLFYSLKPVKVVDFASKSSFITGILTRLTGEKFCFIHGDYYCVGKKAGKRIASSRQYELDHGFTLIDNKEFENEYYYSTHDTDRAHRSYSRFTRLKNYLPIYFNHKNKLVCLSMFTLHTPEEKSIEEMKIHVGEKMYELHTLRRHRRSKKHRGVYWFSVPLSDVVDLPSKNQVTVAYTNKHGKNADGAVMYEGFLRNRSLALRGPMCIDKETKTVAAFRQLAKNRLNVYVRSANVSDDLRYRIKQAIAYAFSLIWFGKKASSLILLYEKNSSKYEESASVLYEKLIDHGYKNAYFIIDKSYEFFDVIPEKYRKNLLYKNTFRHYLYFFRSKTFIGTEALVHAIDLKTFNKLALKKTISKDLNYVFLQHGVMYMVSLDSESRKMFKRKKLRGKYRVVVSSQAEADHFTQLGRHYETDIYITGLPKFDKNQYDPNADKIVIMPTWRPWEINESRSSFTDTNYFRMIMKIYDSVPDELKEKVVILPHPLIVNELSKLSDSISDKIVLDARYDDILKETAVLITDYSSIAYDAFYRGARVIFYWEEKDYCMEQYGPSTKLMLNEENVYGDFFYSEDGLREAISRNYSGSQTAENVERYSKIVEFHDGRNTERLIEFLKADEII